MIWDSHHTLNPLKKRHALFHGISHTRVRIALGRLQFLMGTLCCLFFILTVRMIDLSIVGPDDSLPTEGLTTARRDMKSTHIFQPIRASIYDRNGQLMALSIPVDAAFIRTSRLIQNPKVLAPQIAKILHKHHFNELPHAIREKKLFLWISRKLTPRQKEQLIRLGEPGIEFQTIEHRLYPHGKQTSHLVGEVDVDGAGVSGLEKGFDQDLRHKRAIRTSIDVRCQQKVFQTLESALLQYRAKAGNALVLKIHTGEVISAVSLPTFTPGETVEDSVNNPRFNRNTLGVYEVGSTMKIINTAMILESGLATLDTAYNTVDPLTVGRFRIRDYHPATEWMSVEKIFVKSSNIGSARIAQAVGPEKQKAFFAHLGLFDKPNFELPERGAPLYPKLWTEAHTITTSYGYGYSTSPIQFASTVSALISDGIHRPPTFLKRDSPISGTQLVQQRTARQLRALMRKTVVEGTARKSRVDDYITLAKTGTANLRKGRHYTEGHNMTSFVGTFGSSQDHPEYLVLVMLEDPKGIPETHGLNAAGWNAAPTGGAIIEQLAPLLNVSPSRFSEAPDVLSYNINKKYLSQFVKTSYQVKGR